MVILHCECFGEKISEIVGAATPNDVELALSNAVADPMPAHVDGLATLLLDGIVGQADGACIVAENGGGRLWVP